MGNEPGTWHAFAIELLVSAVCELVFGLLELL